MRRIHVGLVVAVLCGLFAGTAGAAAPEAKNPAGKIRGVVFAHGQRSNLAGTNGNLSYHSGPVMHTNKVYAIYWIPSGYSVQSGYQSVIDGYFQNVAADSGKPS